jgi:FkbM family methyltransferase
MSCRTLVITLGQLRAHQLTWANFKENVLDQLQADLAVCAPDDAFFDFTNPFYLNARFRWLIPDAPDLADTFDRIQRILGSSEEWRVLCDVKGSWLGKISQSNQPGAAAILLILRWFMLNDIEAARLTDVYDRFVITRSDFYYLCPHPPLECLSAESVWIPDGEDYGGLCDRHLVVSATELAASCNLIGDLLLHPQQLREAMIERSNWNIEQLIAFHFTRNGLMSKVRRFPYVMCLVRASGDPSASSPGNYITDVGMVVKYPSELDEANRYRNFLRSNEDWRLYFAYQYFADLLPARIYTTHGTVLYVDEVTRELRHGLLPDSPANVLFVVENALGRIVHRSGGRVYDTIYLSDRSKSSSALTESDDHSRELTMFERVPIQRGFSLNQTLMTNNLVGLRAGELYLSAEPDGRVTLNRPHCFMWEHFRLITELGTSPSNRGAFSVVDRPIISLPFRNFESAVSRAPTSQIYRFLTFALENCRKSKAQLFQDIWVLFELASKHDGFFVEFGAGDGVHTSNTFLLEREYGWSGIVAEPNPVHHKSLRENRRCYVSTKCIAATSNDTVPFVQTADPIYSTMEKYSLNDMHAGARREGRKIAVETLSLLDLLVEAGAPKRIDYLSIDTEGSELEILSNFDFDAYNIRIITIEHNYTQQRELIYELLRQKGYERTFAEFSKWDDWYVNSGED